MNHMNTARRVQLFLSPVMIAMLCIMLAVVSFGWYQAEFNGQIEVTDSSVDVTVEAPEYIDVILSKDPIGDNYTYSNNMFTINKTSSTLGYFGQTGKYDVSSDNVDRPYIVFYDMTIIGSGKEIDVNCAYVNGLEITGSDVNESDWEVDETKFKVRFYTKDKNGNLVNENETFENINRDDKYNITEYVIGIYFDDPIEDEFKYSDYEYYGSTYNLKLKFYLK